MKASYNDILPPSFYRRTDVVRISKALLGKYLCTRINGTLTAGMIVETEAYCGANDKACHAYGYKRTKRTEVMFRPGGTAYVYLCYGIHHLFNIITNREGEPDAVLIRAVEPVAGLDVMHKRRGIGKADHRLTHGPGMLTQALGITLNHNKHALFEPPVWVANSDRTIHDNEMLSGPRVGIDYAGEDAQLPWRFRVKKECLP